MGLYGSAPPKPDKNIGVAALKSAETGEQYLEYMKSQAAVTNGWAEEDRSRYQNVYQPLEDAYIAEAQTYDSPERQAAAAGEAVADVRQQSALAQQASTRQMSAMGVNPASGRFSGERARAATSEALASAGAANNARRTVRAQGDAMRANAINMGKGLAVNPATSMGLSNGASNAGFQGAMAGYGQQGSLLIGQHNAQMNAWQAQQQQTAGLGQALGMVAGAAWGSSEEIKHDKRPVMGVLDAVKDMRVEKWKYNDGEGDGGEHIGPYAEEFAQKTGLGNGKEISVIDAVGVAMGAIKELAHKVDAMDGAKGARE